MQNPLMRPTPGITEPNLTAEPLGTEAEMTPGPDDINPFRSERERRIVDEIEAQRRTRARQPSEESLEDTLGMDGIPNPTRGDDPYAFDDVDEAVDDVGLPALRDDPRGRFL